MAFLIRYTMLSLVRRLASTIGMWWLICTGVFVSVAFAEILPLFGGVKEDEWEIFLMQVLTTVFLCLLTVCCALYTMLLRDFRQHRDEYDLLRRNGCTPGQLVVHVLLRLTTVYVLAAPLALLVVRVYGRLFVDHYNRVMAERPWLEVFRGTAWESVYETVVFSPGTDWMWILPLCGVFVWLTGLLAWQRAGVGKMPKRVRFAEMEPNGTFVGAYDKLHRKRTATAFRATAVGIVVGLTMPVMLFCATMPSPPTERKFDMYISPTRKEDTIPLDMASWLTSMPGVKKYEVFTIEHREETELVRMAYDSVQILLADEDWAENAMGMVAEIERQGFGERLSVRISKISLMDSQISTGVENIFVRLQGLLLLLAASVQLFFIAAELLRERKTEFDALFRMGLTEEDIQKLCFREVFHKICFPMQFSVVLATVLFVWFSYLGGDYAVRYKMVVDALYMYLLATVAVLGYSALVAGFTTWLHHLSQGEKKGNRL